MSRYRLKDAYLGKVDSVLEGYLGSLLGDDYVLTSVSYDDEDACVNLICDSSGKGYEVVISLFKPYVVYFVDLDSESDDVFSSNLTYSMVEGLYRIVTNKRSRVKV